MYGIREECAQNLTRSLFAVALCNLTEVVALALVLVGRRHKRRSRGRMDIGFWFRFSKNTAVDGFVRSLPNTLVRARRRHADSLVADRFLGRKMVDRATLRQFP